MIQQRSYSHVALFAAAVTIFVPETCLAQAKAFDLICVGTDRQSDGPGSAFNRHFSVDLVSKKYCDRLNCQPTDIAFVSNENIVFQDYQNGPSYAHVMVSRTDGTMIYRTYFPPFAPISFDAKCISSSYTELPRPIF